jgi:hypothetical protein
MAAAPAAAQGRGNGLGKGRHEPSAIVPAGGDTSASGAPSGGREFGTWLDDATLADPGSGWIAVSLGSYFSPAGRQTDFPSLDGAFGWTDRIQFGMTVPYSRFRTVDGQTISGRGDVYLSSKLSIWDHTANSSGKAIAMTPLIEVLSEPDPVDGGRLFWAFPVSGEIRRSGYRIYGSGGYFSRGVFFGGGALEIPASERLITTTALTWTRSLASDPVADALGMSPGRVDVTCGASYVLNPSFAVFGSLGRTLSKIDANSATMMLNAGFAFTYAQRGSRPPSRRP